ncbi:hypothetical protein IRY61_03575 [Candidatus Saccharibacteria bacterium]|jgi:hypothetical protein|nr:hypothetical protein [Candidatus Saccharibacteria bacterium]
MNFRFILGFVATVALVVLVAVLVIRGLSGGGRPADQIDLIDYSKTQTVMRMIITGPVKADQEHRSVRVTVGRSSNTIEMISGYEGNVIDSRTYPSNESAYATFLRAIDLQGYTRGDTNPEREDSRGYCPTGLTYTFQIITGSDTVQSLWTTTCDRGTFRGNARIIRTLFREQIPDFGEFVRGTGLS